MKKENKQLLFFIGVALLVLYAVSLSAPDSDKKEGNEWWLSFAAIFPLFIVPIFAGFFTYNSWQWVTQNFVLIAGILIFIVMLKVIGRKRG